MASLGVDEQSFPVFVMVKRPDGSSESVRVGTAVRAGDGFRLSLGELSIGSVPDATPARGSAAPPRPASGNEGLVFPPYGRSRGMPIAGASLQDLQFYISGSRRSLDDPAKARWHEKERVLLAAMEAELARQTGGADARGQNDEGGASRRGGGSSGADEYDPGPIPSDDDIPF